MRKNGDAAGSGKGLLSRGNYRKTALNICTISHLFAASWILLKRLKMAEEHVRTLQINHAQFHNTFSF